VTSADGASVCPAAAMGLFICNTVADVDGLYGRSASAPGTCAALRIRSASESDRPDFRNTETAA
jgi:hypothetical protein